MICAAFVAWFFRRVRECRDAESWLLLLMLFDLFLHAMLELPLHYAYYLLPAGFAMGMLAARGRSSISTRRWPRLSLAIPAVLLSVLTGAIAAQYLAAEEALRELELSARGIGGPPDKLARVAWPLLESWAAYYRAATVKVESTMPTAELENIRTVASRYPYPNILERFAQALTLTGDPVNARLPLLLSCKLHTTAVCDGMRRRWNRFRSENSGFASVDFPGVDELRNPERL